MAPASAMWREAAFARIALNEVWLSSCSSRPSAAVPLLAPMVPPARMVLNRVRRRLQKGVEPRLYHSVAFTHCLLQAGTIGDLDRPPAVADETGGLHRLRGNRHRFAVGTQHLSQKFVRVCQVIAAGAIMHHEEPPAQSLFDRMPGIARGGLLNLRQQRLRITYKEIAHVFAPLELPLQNLDGNADQRPFQLHEAFIEGGSTIHGREEPECAFVANVRRLDCRAVLQTRQQRENGAHWEVGVFKLAARLANSVTERKGDWFNVGFDPRAAGGLKGAEQTIGDLAWVDHWFEWGGAECSLSHATM